jgi:Tfp pilus assembly protein PilF
LNKPEEGIVVLENAANTGGSPFQIRLRLAEEYLKLQRIDEAEARFHVLLQESSDNPRVLLGHGHILIRRGRPAEAIAPLKTAAQHPTARQTARFALAEAYGRMGNEIAAENERTLADKTQADQLWPDPYLAEAIEMEAGLQPRIDRSIAMAANGQTQEAHAILARVLMSHPDSDEAHLAMAKVFVRSADFAGADVEVNRAIELNPNLVEAHFVRAGIRMQFKDYDAAEHSCLRAVELKPSFGAAHYLRGDCQLKLGRKSQAMHSFREVLRSRPDLAAAHRELGALLLDQGKVDDAIRCLENAVRLDGADARAKTLLEQARANKK